MSVFAPEEAEAIRKLSRSEGVEGWHPCRGAGLLGSRAGGFASLNHRLQALKSPASTKPENVPTSQARSTSVGTGAPEESRE